MNKPSNLLSIKWTSFDLSFIIRTSWGGRYIIFMNFIIHQFILQTEQKILVVEVTTGAFAVVVCIIVKLRKPTIGNLSYNLQLYNITIQLPIHTTSNIQQQWTNAASKSPLRKLKSWHIATEILDDDGFVFAVVAAGVFCPNCFDLRWILSSVLVETCASSWYGVKHLMIHIFFMSIVIPLMPQLTMILKTSWKVCLSRHFLFKHHLNPLVSQLPIFQHPQMPSFQYPIQTDFLKNMK